jgi:hypothetical protein
MTMELADETDDEEQVLAMQGELLTCCLLHLHHIRYVSYAAFLPFNLTTSLL